jgi:hypothetical protein
MLSIIKECKLKTKSKKLFRLASLFVAIFSISTPAVMFFSAGTVTLNLFVDGFWMLGLFQSFVFTIVASYINDMLNNPAYSWSMFNIHHSD